MLVFALIVLFYLFEVVREAEKERIERLKELHKIKIENSKLKAKTKL